MDSDEFFFKLWKILCLSIIAVALTIGGSISYVNTVDNMAIVELVKHGAAPVDARCAIRPDIHSCIVRASK